MGTDIKLRGSQNNIASQLSGHVNMSVAQQFYVRDDFQNRSPIPQLTIYGLLW
jgi:hypothetical protein